MEQWDEALMQAIRIEPLGHAATCEETVNQIRTQIYPQTYFAEHLRMAYRL